MIQIPKSKARSSSYNLESVLPENVKNDGGRNGKIWFKMVLFRTFLRTCQIFRQAFDPSLKKKKKKKKTPFDLDGAMNEEGGEGTAPGGDEAEPEADVDLDTFGKKKKKKKKPEDGEDKAEGDDENDGEH